MPLPAEPHFQDDASGEAWFQKGVTLLEGRKQEREIEAKLRNTTSRYAVLARQVTSSTYAAVASDVDAGGWIGIFREPNPRRNYPMGSVASNVVGFMNQNKGAGGLELRQQAQRRGLEGAQHPVDQLVLALRVELAQPRQRLRVEHGRRRGAALQIGHGAGGQGIR